MDIDNWTYSGYIYFFKFGLSQTQFQILRTHNAHIFFF